MSPKLVSDGISFLFSFLTSSYPQWPRTHYVSPGWLLTNGNHPASDCAGINDMKSPHTQSERIFLRDQVILFLVVKTIDLG